MSESCCGRDMACVRANYTSPIYRQYLCEVCGQSRSVADPPARVLTVEEFRAMLAAEGRTIVDRDGRPVPVPVRGPQIP